MQVLRIAVCTAGRPQMLAKCLMSIAEQPIPPGWDVAVIVVENGAEAGAVKVVDLANAASEIAFYHILEPQPGIPIARNCSVKSALQHNADWIAFIDDDETLVAGWLSAMVAHANSRLADVYHGPIRSLLPQKVPDWIPVDSDIEKHQQGKILQTAATNNTLVSSRLFYSNGLAQRFDENYRFTGGSDHEYFYRVGKMGATIIWVNDAIVEETVPASRLTMKWQLRRAFRTAANNVRIHYGHRGIAATLWRTIAKFIGRFFAAIFFDGIKTIASIASPQRARAHGFAGLKKLASCLGMLSGLVGIQPQPYKKLDGR